MFRNLVCLICLVCSVSFASALEIPRFYGQEIIVTAARLPQLSTTSPWNVDVIPQEALRGKTNLGEVLREIPGIDIKSSGYLGSVTSSRLRGSTSQQVLVLIDGKRANSPLLGMIDLGDILLDNVERIEVARAPLSALYGSDAIGGVVNVITKKKDNAFTVAYGTYNTQKANLSLGGTAISLIKSDGFRQNGDYTAQQIGQKLGWALRGIGDVGMSLTYYNSDKGVPGVPNSQTDLYSASTPGDRQKDQNLFADLSLNRKDGDLMTEAKIYYNNLYEYSRYYDFFAQNFIDSDFRTEQKAVELTQSRDFKNSFTLLHGIEAREDSGRSTYAGNHSVDNYALFGQMQFNNKNLNLVTGARVDAHSTFGSVVSPRIGINYEFLNDCSLKASAGSAFKAPTLNDLFYNNPTWFTFGNPNLSPERSQSAEIGIEKRFGRLLSFSFNYYLSSISDLILWDYDPLTYTTRVKNVGAVEGRGGELELKYQATPMLEMFANYTLQKTQDVKDTNPANVGKNTPYSPETKYTAGVKVLENVRITSTYVGPRFADGANTISLPEYSLVSLWAGKEFKGYLISLNIDNLFNQVYYETVGYRPATYAQLPYPMPGRRIAVSIGGKI
ncbi:MAG: TonB-dependent receptor [Candidatus Margulisiibacteriota bacterium]